MSKLEEKLAFQIKVAGLATPEREYRFWPGRRFRFDFAWPVLMVAAECEGGTWTQGRHTRGKGFRRDCIKYNEAALQGWCVLRFTTDMIDAGGALAWLERVVPSLAAVPCSPA